ncbi:hypothetical protein [Nostoc sp. DSM 114167]|jgi:hypothetical protein|uniref:hypothetical protein n=1 Tax=Nostoc sp. DSM 114167 TaxID=3439050 RepID=UPI00404568CD
MQTSDLIALIAVVISLYAVWMQNKGVQQQLLVANISAYTKRYQEIFEKLPKNILDENFDFGSLTEDEKEKLLRYVWLYFDLCYEEHMLYHELKLIDQKLWKLWEFGMTSAFKRPAFYQCWKYVFENSYYPRSFNKFVSDKMSDMHNRGRRI